jgi:hypothetical protein
VEFALARKRRPRPFLVPEQPAAESPAAEPLRGRTGNQQYGRRPETEPRP